jgi:hypothetical protein
MSRCKECGEWGDTRFNAEDLEACNDVFGFVFSWRGKTDKHVIIELFSGDDESYRQIASFSVYWLDSIISLLETARQRLKDSKRFKIEQKEVYFLDKGKDRWTT